MWISVLVRTGLNTTFDRFPCSHTGYVHTCICMQLVYLLVFSDADINLHKDHETLLLTVESLKAQLEEQTRLCKEQVSQCNYIVYAFS